MYILLQRFSATVFMCYFFLYLIHTPEDIQYHFLFVFRLQVRFLPFSLLDLLSENRLKKNPHDGLYEKQLCKKRKWEVEADEL